MKYRFNIKLIVFIFAFAFGLLLTIPSVFGTKGPKVVLGLDLQGGLSSLFNVNLNEAIKNKYSVIASRINAESNDKNVLLDYIKSNPKDITFELIDISQKDSMDNILKNIQGIDIVYNNGKYLIRFSKEEESLIKESVMQQSVDILRDRINIFGLTEPSITRQGKENILIQLPGIKDASEEKRIMELILRPAFLKMMAVDEDRINLLDSMDSNEAKKFGDVILPFINNPDSKILLKEIAILDGSQITDARVMYDGATNNPIVSFTLNYSGSRIFADFSGNNIGKRLAIVLDNKVYSAPVINERIGGGTGQISGNFTLEEASNIVIALKSGALSAPLELLEKRTIGPSLGDDSIKLSMIALVGAFLSIIIFMVVYYNLAGMISVIALFVNILIIIAVMSLFGATLTLPGMAGIVLTVGMAIDANIIINERIREAIYAGNNALKSISFGYANATRAIFDANNTTLIIAVILYFYGTGPIKGFAVTMGIGIIASIITAIIGTHGVYLWLGNKILNSKNINFWFGLKKNKLNKGNM